MKRTRIEFSKEQVSHLESAWQNGLKTTKKKRNPATLKNLSEVTGLTQAKIDQWIGNRRAKHRRIGQAGKECAPKHMSKAKRIQGPNGYSLFVRGFKRGTKPQGEFLKEMGQRWQQLPPEEKKSFSERAANLRQTPSLGMSREKLVSRHLGIMNESCKFLSSIGVYAGGFAVDSQESGSTVQFGPPRVVKLLEPTLESFKKEILDQCSPVEENEYRRNELKRIVQEKFNSAWNNASKRKGRVPYTKIEDKKVQVICRCLPVGVEFKNPSRYSLDILQAIADGPDLHLQILNVQADISVGTSASNVAVPGPSHTLTGPSHTLTGPSHTLTGPSHALIGPSHALIGPSHTLTGPSHSLTGPSHTLTGPSHTLTGPSHTLTGPSHTLTGPSHSLTAPSHALIGPSHALIGPSHALTGPSHALTGPFHTLTGPSHTLTGPSHTLTGPSHTLTGPSHALIGPSHALTGPSHTLTGPSHTLIGPSHTLTGPSHTLIGPSHTLTGPSHTLTGPSHSLIGPSHTLTGPSHTLTGPSHTLTGPSHTLTGPSHALTGPSHALIAPSHALIAPSHTLTEPSITGLAASYTNASSQDASSILAELSRGGHSLVEMAQSDFEESRSTEEVLPVNQTSADNKGKSRQKRKRKSRVTGAHNSKEEIKDSTLYKVEKVLRTKYKKSLVKWEGFETPTWELTKNIVEI